MKTLQTKVKNVLSHNKNTLQPNEYHTYKNGRDEYFMSPTLIYVPDTCKIDSCFIILCISFPAWKVFVDTGYKKELKGITNYLTVTMNL